MKKKEVVKKKEDFHSIINNCPYKKNECFSIYIRKKTEEQKLFGIAISKKVGNAVIRNKLKRRVRAILDEIKQDFPKYNDYIIIIKKRCGELSYQEIKDKLIQLMKEII